MNKIRNLCSKYDYKYITFGKVFGYIHKINKMQLLWILVWGKYLLNDIRRNYLIKRQIKNWNEQRQDLYTKEPKNYKQMSPERDIVF